MRVLLVPVKWIYPVNAVSREICQLRSTISFSHILQHYLMRLRCDANQIFIERSMRDSINSHQYSQMFNIHTYFCICRYVYVRIALLTLHTNAINF